MYYDLSTNHVPSNEELIIPLPIGRYLLSNNSYDNTLRDEEFNLFRLKNNIPIHGIDYTNEMLLNIHEEKYVSYTKGCFVGQEMIAKVHYRAKPPKKLVVNYEDDCSEAERLLMTSVTLNPENGKKFGFVFVKNVG